jgi:SAM-dependent methyltransferase
MVNIHCTVCSSSEVRKEPFHYFWKDRRWDMMRCRQCTHGFVFPPVGEFEQKEMYSDDYFDAAGDWVEGYWPLSYLEAEPRLREEALQVLDMIPVSRGHMPEIGCAGGFFLDEARKRGFEVAGIETNESMAAHARERLGLNVINARIEDVGDDAFAHRFDVLVMMDVLEHIPHPRELFGKASRWLAPGAYVLVRGPLHNDPMAQLKEGLRRLARIEKQLPGYPLDANAFTRRSLTRLLEGAEVGELSWIGEVRGFANLVGRRRAGA